MDSFKAYRIHNQDGKIAARFDEVSLDQIGVKYRASLRPYLRGERRVTGASTRMQIKYFVFLIPPHQMATYTILRNYD